MPEITSIEQQINDLGNKVGRLQGEYNMLVKDQTKSQTLINKYEEESVITSQAVELLTKVQEVTRDKVKNKFEDLVSYALRFITQEDYKFILDFDKRGNLGELDFKVLSPNGEEPENPVDQNGEGIKDIIGVALRAVLMEVSNPKINGFLVFDESFKQLSKGNLELAWEFIKQLNKKLDRQVIFITHCPVFIENSDNLIEIK